MYLEPGIRVRIRIGIQGQDVNPGQHYGQLS